MSREAAKEFQAANSKNMCFPNSIAAAHVCLLLLVRSLASGETSRAVSFSYIGCYNDNSGGVRALNGLSGLSSLGAYGLTSNERYESGSMTHEMCSKVCSLGGFAYFGVENTKQCFCGNSYDSQGSKRESWCSLLCTGDMWQRCGGLGSIGVFSLTYLDKRNIFLSATRSQLIPSGSYTGPTFWSVNAVSSIQCASRCAVKPDCQAVLFDKKLLACRLLRFAAVPSALNGIGGVFLVRP